ncbi:hypothetical protein FEM48_ZijujUnG0081400 [Ziziphus jujuba var. spinosa]|uniref:23 kDa jasmonate-induced protein-like n=1 Tax=Ziziphus jujuba var. spinosa TaxID=714518 RepID=A0A978U8N2_ZIZJJ|nr:hypothetical protein FEM48_ZijujUnG0081400 [Ziziphus jujuba var. spinosa]
MALNVFSNPIRNQTLKAMPEYQDKEVITPVDKAYVALMMKDADNKSENARKFVEGLKPKYGAALISTLRFIYNATGNRLTFVGYRDWEGHIGDSPYPLLLENGQWGAFLHVHHGSFAATIYCGQDENGDAFDWILSWYNPRNDTRSGNNGVCTEIHEANQFKGINRSSIHDNVWGKLTNADHHYSSATLNGCYSIVITGYSDVIDSDNRISPIFEGIMTLKNAWIQ